MAQRPYCVQARAQSFPLALTLGATYNDDQSAERRSAGVVTYPSSLSCL